MNGIGAGGFAEGFQNQQLVNANQQNANTNTQKVKLLETAEKNRQERELFARADGEIDNLWKVMDTYVNAAKAAGAKDPDIAQHAQNLLGPIKDLLRNSGRDPTIADRMFQMKIASPVTLTLSKPTKISEDLFGATYGVYDPKIQDWRPLTPKETGATQPGIGGPGPLSQQNLTGPDTTITGVDYGPVQTSGSQPPTQMAQAASPAAPVPAQAAPAAPTEGAPAPTFPPSTNPIIRKLVAAGITDDKTLDFQAQRYNLGDTSVAAGLGYGKLGQARRQALQTRAAELASLQGQTPADVNAQKLQLHASGAALTQLTKMKSAVEAFSNSEIKNGDVLLKLAQKADKTGVPVIERWIRAGRRSLVGDPDVSNFNIQLQLYRNGVAKIITNPNLTGVLTVEAMQEMKNVLGNDVTYDMLKGAHELLKGDFGRRREALDEQIGEIKKSFGPSGKSSGAKSSEPPPPPPGNWIDVGR